MAWLDIWTPAHYDITPFIKSGYMSSEMYTSILSLQMPEEELWMGLDGKARNMIRKAIKNNVHVVEGDESLVGEYYQMVIATFTRSQIKPQPESYYHRVIQDLGPKGMARLLLANHNNKFIAGAIFLFYKDTAYYWHGASYRDHLSVAPNELIQWELIKWARQNGYKNYDLVRIEPDRLPGIARFKISFGGKTVPCYHLQKGTRRYLWMRLLRLIRNPKRTFTKLRIFAAGKGNANQKNNPQTCACSTN
jgi:lipid II:glycine glycyltransferase (peptidoglycan interpeptide bridge formation enzyme)